MLGRSFYNGRGGFIIWNTENSILPSNDISDIKQDALGNIRLACYQHIVLFDGRKFAVYPSPLVEENNIMNFISCLEFDNHGNIWFGTKLSGLHRFTPVQENFRQVLNLPIFRKTKSVIGRELQLFHKNGKR
jgi:ligand-binding sensor domain-containing protein